MTLTTTSNPQKTIIESGFPANVPDRLIQEFLAADCKFRKLARRLDVNPAHVWNLIKKGHEPKNKTIREKLYLPGKVRSEIPSWLRQGTQTLASLEEKAQPSPGRTYNRLGKRVT